MSGYGDSTDPLRLVELAETIVVRPVASLVGALGAFDAAASVWGFVATAARVDLGRYPLDRWRELLGHPRLVEARLFDDQRDLHWLEGRGVLLSVDHPADPGGAQEQSPADLRIEGKQWLQRDRRSRLWGEHLGGTESWYEERIPDPLRYPGIEPVDGHRYVFLRYREYVRGGRVEIVRYLEVVGGSK